MRCRFGPGKAKATHSYEERSFKPSEIEEKLWFLRARNPPTLFCQPQPIVTSQISSGAEPSQSSKQPSGNARRNIGSRRSACEPGIICFWPSNRRFEQTLDWTFYKTKTFEAATLKAANLGDDADTTAERRRLELIASTSLPCVGSLIEATTIGTANAESVPTRGLHDYPPIIPGHDSCFQAFQARNL